MAGNRKSRAGKILTWLGCVWFALAFVWLSPLMILFSLVEPVWRFPYAFYRIIGRAEFPMAAATAAVGVLLWRRTTRKLSPIDYVIVLAGASVAVLGVSGINGWIHLW